MSLDAADATIRFVYSLFGAVVHLSVPRNPATGGGAEIIRGSYSESFKKLLKI